MPVTYERKDRIGYVTLNRPETGNTIDTKTLEEIDENLLRFRDDREAWICVVAAAGDNFSLGEDLQEIEQRALASNPVPPPWTSPNPSFIFGQVEIWEPVIVAINGLAQGIGAEFALSCDLKVMEEDATIRFNQGRWGLAPKAACTRLPHIIGIGRALYYLWSGDPITAQQAYDLGLVNRLAPKGQGLAGATQLANELLENAPITRRFQKERAYRSVGVPIWFAYNMVVGPDPYNTEDNVEGVRAWVEKRKPLWKNR